MTLLLSFVLGAMGAPTPTDDTGDTAATGTTTGSTADTTDTGPPPAQSASELAGELGGCHCRTSPSGSLAWLALGALVALRRRSHR